MSLKIKDTGIGISQDFLNQVFDEFRQESEGFARSHEGSGLGLSITKKLIERMGGEIAIRSQKYAGTTVVISLPLAEEVAAAPVGETATSEIIKAPRADILVVEDDVAIGELLQHLLGESNCVWVKTGEKAIAAASKRKFALVLVDMHLKDSRYDGMGTLQELRRLPDYEKTPILALTAYAMAGDKERLLTAGFDNYLAKPFQASDLFRVIEQHLDQA